MGVRKNKELRETRFNEDLGLTVRLRRREQRMSAAILATRLGISKVTLWKYESGQCAMSLFMVLRCASIFGVTLASLAGPALTKGNIASHEGS